MISSPGGDCYYPQHVMVLAGGLSTERDVSWRSGRRLADALRRHGFDVSLYDVDPQLTARLMGQSRDGGIAPDVVIPMLHGAQGEDGSLREVLELLGVSYVGTQPDGCRVAWDKPCAKAAFRGAGLSTPQAVTLPQSAFAELGASRLVAAISPRLGMPVVVKPSRGGSALGATLVRHADELPAALVTCFGYGDVALIERYIPGTEVAVCVVDTGAGPLALPPVEIIPDGPLYDYHARYVAGSTEFFVPARLSPEVIEAASQAAVKAHLALGLRDLSRADLIVGHDGDIQVLEVCVAPGMTETSLFPLAASASGRDLGIWWRDLVLLACERTT